MCGQGLASPSTTTEQITRTHGTTIPKSHHHLSIDWSPRIRLVFTLSRPPGLFHRAELIFDHLCRFVHRPNRNKISVASLLTIIPIYSPKDLRKTFRYIKLWVVVIVNWPASLSPPVAADDHPIHPSIGPGGLTDCRVGALGSLLSGWGFGRPMSSPFPFNKIIWSIDFNRVPWISKDSLLFSAY